MTRGSPARAESLQAPPRWKCGVISDIPPRQKGLTAGRARSSLAALLDFCARSLRARAAQVCCITATPPAGLGLRLRPHFSVTVNERLVQDQYVSASVQEGSRAASPLFLLLFPPSFLS